MGNPIEEVYSSKQYCFDEILRIREMFGNKNTFTMNNCEVAQKSLGFMLLYCPEEIRYMVEATIDELQKRIVYGKPKMEI